MKEALSHGLQMRAPEWNLQADLRSAAQLNLRASAVAWMVHSTSETIIYFRMADNVCDVVISDRSTPRCGLNPYMYVWWVLQMVGHCQGFYATPPPNAGLVRVWYT